MNGILCENETDLAYAKQAGQPFPDSALLDKDGDYFIYLDVWEQHLTWTQKPSIREVALGGPDTATRARVVWQVKALPRPASLVPAAKTGDFEKYLRDNFSAVSKTALRARTTPAPASGNPCVIDPTSRYRGLENQLYRVEIHQGTDPKDPTKLGTFKWSRDNGSVTFPIVTLSDNQVEVANLGRDDSRSLNVNDWVEIMDDDLALRGQPGLLTQVTKVKDHTITINPAAPDPYNKQSPNHPLLRRWDHRGKASELTDGALVVSEGEGDDQKQWITLEDGTQVQFKLPVKPDESSYRSGDYWLIPARTATGNVEWPQQLDASGKPATYPGGTNPIPAAREPHGVEHHYAPLAALTFGLGLVTSSTPLKRTFKAMAL